jgi:hypothetical protein
MISFIHLRPGVKRLFYSFIYYNPERGGLKPKFILHRAIPVTSAADYVHKIYGPAFEDDYKWECLAADVSETRDVFLAEYLNIIEFRYRGRYKLFINSGQGQGVLRRRCCTMKKMPRTDVLRRGGKECIFRTAAWKMKKVSS